MQCSAGAPAQQRWMHKCDQQGSQLHLPCHAMHVSAGITFACAPSRHDVAWLSSTAAAAACCRMASMLEAFSRAFNQSTV